MPHFHEWLKDFAAGKTELPSVEASDQFALHSIRRFLENSSIVWEIAITYTGRLVVRSGEIKPDGFTVAWKEWSTKHDVIMPKS